MKTLTFTNRALVCLLFLVQSLSVAAQWQLNANKDIVTTSATSGRAIVNTLQSRTMVNGKQRIELDGAAGAPISGHASFTFFDDNAMVFRTSLNGTYLNSKFYTKEINFYGGSGIGSGISEAHIKNGDLMISLRKAVQAPPGNDNFSFWDGNNRVFYASVKGTYINSKLFTKEITVKASGWSDFVFDKEYDLPSLTEVESYINKNHHLQDIPSAKEVQRDGINLGEMDAKLLRKIEELTLYVIEQNKNLLELNTYVKTLESKIQKLENGN
jgi:hypothetical protein